MNLITSFLEYLLLEKKYSIHTVTAYKKDLISLQDFCKETYQQEKISEIHYSQIRSWIVYLVEAKVSNRSINRKISSLKSFYKYLQKGGNLKPSVKISREKKPYECRKCGEYGI